MMQPLTRRLVIGAALAQGGCTSLAFPRSVTRPDYAVGPLLHRDDFRNGLGAWSIELERGGTVQARNGLMDVDVPAGATLWFRQELLGPVMIEYDAVAVAENGPNDRVSDLNAFWMATTSDTSLPVPDQGRDGAFTAYDALKTYYVGQGGNANTTTRMRRYVGEAGNRPLLPGHDLSSPDVLLRPGRRHSVRLVAAGNRVEYWCNGVRLFQLNDAAPYLRGWFAIRTTFSHLRISDLRIHTVITRP